MPDSIEEDATDDESDESTDEAEDEGQTGPSKRQNLMHLVIQYI